jgi:hypothetical protein
MSSNFIMAKKEIYKTKDIKTLIFLLKEFELVYNLSRKPTTQQIITLKKHFKQIIKCL